MWVVSLEWVKDNICLNIIYFNGVFDIGFWIEEVLEVRVKYYGLIVEEYKGNNLLKVEVISQDVVELVIVMVSFLFGKIIGV